MRVKMSKPPPPAPTASAIGPCPTVIKNVGRPGTGSLPSTIAPPDHSLYIGSRACETIVYNTSIFWVYSLCTQSIVDDTSINIRKIKLIAYIYIHFNQNLQENFYISAKSGAVKHQHAVFSANCGTAPTSNQIVESHGLL